MPSWKAWVKRPRGLVKRGRKRERFGWRLQNCFYKKRLVSRINPSLLLNIVLYNT